MHSLNYRDCDEHRSHSSYRYETTQIQNVVETRGARNIQHSNENSSERRIERNLEPCRSRYVSPCNPEMVPGVIHGADGRSATSLAFHRQRRQYTFAGADRVGQNAGRVSGRHRSVDVSR